ncbi:probable WRKY transcription factor 75 [Chenopodium quinoa]|uniref:probable WRKY transcription factor 75 n=1 Tax=Chenopodium quinoa TaxID=63459 RepID=UPI000B793CF0|nr:probable WRKY transcription factor 75 [Chenopodium quinoa]
MTTTPFSSIPLENFPFSLTNIIPISHHTPISSSSSSLIDVYKNGLIGIKTTNTKTELGMEMDMNFQHDHGKRLAPNEYVGSSSGGIKENKKDNKEKMKLRRHRYAFHTRSQVDILDDGYRWRKYGQKAVKNNKFPRSYYRCTHGGCNVKKQVQRLTKDEEVVVTTYEGVHTHPVERSTDNFEHILKQMQIYVPP